ncbi:hypothetical protein GcM1_146009 [Golovinomyces cichoracearum]|uniref:Uncharacterized protein n=1 Tax=Golovinomyces cichoracearum TaxID=62708 RepID=A0A420JBA2_9PEZI|nr:hypothetical protein GcM1_146009 [Golovinomyces cichoracearum]
MFSLRGVYMTRHRTGFRNKTLCQRTMSGGPSSSANLNPDSIPDKQNNPTLPVTLASSTKLKQLPCDTTSAHSAVGEFPKPKVTVHFTAIGSAPILRQNSIKTR